MKIYFKVVLILLILFSTLFGVLPLLYSQQSDIMVLLAIVITTAIPPYIYYSYKWAIK
jgi:hypothetical protein